MDTKEKRGYRKIINILTVILGILIVYSIFITIIFVTTSHELESIKLEVLMEETLSELQ